MTEEQAYQVYLNYIEKNFPRLSIAKMAETLDLSEAQISSIIDTMSWRHFKIAENVRKATAPTTCRIIPFRGAIKP